MFSMFSVVSFFSLFKLNWRTFKRIGIAVLIGMLTFVSMVQYADAKRLGGGRSIGRQSSMIHHSYKPASRPAAQPQHPSQPHPSPSSPAQQTRNRWLGPVAGLAAGLGLAALMSHLGLGGALGGMLSNLIIIGLVILAVYWGIRLFRRNRMSATDAQPVQTPAPAFNFSEPALASDIAAVKMGEDQPPYSSYSTPGISSEFNTTAFLDAAKVLFLRLQAAWDAADLEDIGKFTTPEMFARIKLDLLKRGTASNRTDVKQLEAELVGMEAHSNASVRFSGLIDEGDDGVEKGPKPFTEMWNLIKRDKRNELNDDNQDSWLLAGIQQLTQVDQANQANQTAA